MQELKSEEVMNSDAAGDSTDTNYFQLEPLDYHSESDRLSGRSERSTQTRQNADVKFRAQFVIDKNEEKMSLNKSYTVSVSTLESTDLLSDSGGEHSELAYSDSSPAVTSYSTTPDTHPKEFELRYACFPSENPAKLYHDVIPHRVSKTGRVWKKKSYFCSEPNSGTSNESESQSLVKSVDHYWEVYNTRECYYESRKSDGKSIRGSGFTVNKDGSFRPQPWCLEDPRAAADEESTTSSGGLRDVMERERTDFLYRCNEVRREYFEFQFGAGEHSEVTMEEIRQEIDSRLIKPLCQDYLVEFRAQNQFDRQIDSCRKALDRAKEKKKKNNLMERSKNVEKRDRELQQKIKSLQSLFFFLKSEFKNSLEIPSQTEKSDSKTKTLRVIKEVFSSGALKQKVRRRIFSLCLGWEVARRKLLKLFEDEIRPKLVLFHKKWQPQIRDRDRRYTVLEQSLGACSGAQEALRGLGAQTQYWQKKMSRETEAITLLLDERPILKIRETLESVASIADNACWETDEGWVDVWKSYWPYDTKRMKRYYRFICKILSSDSSKLVKKYCDSSSSNTLDGDHGPNDSSDSCVKALSKVVQTAFYEKYSKDFRPSERRGHRWDYQAAERREY